MNNRDGAIVIIEDDQDDQDILKDIFESLSYKNELIFFKNGNDALAFLDKTDISPFLILSDINMPKIDGLELRNRIYTNEKLHIKCIPYLFFTSTVNKKAVLDAYSMSVQGFFIKPNNNEQLKSSISKIMEYWRECIAPHEYF